MKLLLQSVITGGAKLNENEKLSNCILKRKHIGVLAALWSVDHENSYVSASENTLRRGQVRYEERIILTFCMLDQAGSLCQIYLVNRARISVKN